MKLFSLFLYSLLLLITNHLIAPTYPLTPFLPLLIIVSFFEGQKRLFLLSFFAGLTLDLLNSELPVGFYTIIYSFTSFIMSSYRIYFSDFLPSLFLFSALFSLTLGTVELIALVVLGKLTFHFYPLLVGLIGLAILDATGACMLFFLPSFLFQSIKKSMRRFLFLKKWTKTVKTSTHRKAL